MTLNDQIRELASQHYPTQIARALGITVCMVNGRLRAMNVTPISFIDATKPTDGEWIGVVQTVSMQTGVPVGQILSGSRYKQVVDARWLAFKTLLDMYPEYSIAGLSRTSGFHHSSIIHGLHRLSGAPAFARQDSRATGRVPQHFHDRRRERAERAKMFGAVSA